MKRSLEGLRGARRGGSRRSQTWAAGVLASALGLGACGDGTGPAAEPAVVADVEGLVADVEGFGARTTGGRGGEVVWVTSLAAAGEGTLADAISGDAPRWIRFRVSGEIRLPAPLEVGANKTLDGRGARVVIAGHGLVVAGRRNVIVENLVFRDGAGDALHLVDGAADVWIDHSSFSRFGDGLVDVTRGATDVTISWCRFSEHDKVVLIGASPAHDGDRAIRVTLHHNHFERTGERHPRLRFGKVHAYNNYYEAWGSYGAAASMLGELASEANVYQAGWDRDAIITRSGRDPAAGYARSLGDLLLDGARVHEREPARVFDPREFYASAVEPADEALVGRVARGAGWRDVRMPP
jgi:pectate lyase